MRERESRDGLFGDHASTRPPLQFPSTHVHLLLVELRPVYLVVYAWYQLLKSMATAGMLSGTYAPTLQACTDAAAQRSILFYDFVLHCGLVPAHFMPELRDGARFFYLFYMTVVSALALIAWCEFRLVKTEGIKDFKHFKYCVFTRELEESREFRVLGAIFAVPPAVLVLGFVFYELSAWVSGNDKLHWLPIWSNHIADVGLLCYAIKLILCPSLLSLAPKNFEGVEDKTFERSIYEMLTQSNHAFAVKVWDQRLEKKPSGSETSLAGRRSREAEAANASMEEEAGVANAGCTSCLLSIQSGWPDRSTPSPRSS